jgi:hypothetical protein
VLSCYHLNNFYFNICRSTRQINSSDIKDLYHVAIFKGLIGDLTWAVHITACKSACKTICYVHAIGQQFRSMKLVNIKQEHLWLRVPTRPYLLGGKGEGGGGRGGRSGRRNGRGTLRMHQLVAPASLPYANHNGWQGESHGMLASERWRTAIGSVH